MGHHAVGKRVGTEEVVIYWKIENREKKHSYPKITKKELKKNILVTNL